MTVLAGSSSLIQMHGTAEHVGQIAGDTGFAGFYIDCSDPANEPSTMTESRLRHLRRIGEQLRVVVHGNPRSALASDLADVRGGAIDYTMREVRVASELGSPVVIHGSVLYANYRPRHAIDQSLSGLVDAVATLHEAGLGMGVPVLFENLPPYRTGPFRIVGASLDDVTHLHAQLPEVRFVLDVGHAHLGSDGPSAWWDAIGGSIDVLALSDNAGESDEHLIPGRGSVPLPDLIRRLAEDDWSGPMVFESHAGTPQEARDSFASLCATTDVL